MPSAIDEKRKSISNSRSQILEGRVVANYDDTVNDVGISEVSHFDILSRYVIVMLDSPYRLPTNENWASMFAVCARPQHLWIDALNGKAESSSSQTRTDFLGNTNVGIPGSFSVDGIPKLNKPYQLGESIKFKRIPVPVTVENSSFFLSVFPDNASNDLVYGSWHTQGSTLAYFSSNQTRVDGLRNKTITQPDSSLPLRYKIRLYKYQYEAFMLTLTISDSNMSTYLASIFSNTLPSSDPVYQAQGGYVFKERSYVEFSSVSFEDLNLDNKQRISSDSCLPIIVSSPSQWPTPKQRTLSTISFNPTYATIIKQ